MIGGRLLRVMTGRFPAGKANRRNLWLALRAQVYIEIAPLLLNPSSGFFFGVLVAATTRKKQY